MKWYYSEKLKTYVSLHPLQNDSRILNIAGKLGIKLQWDEFGNINNISFREAKALTKAAGYAMLSPSEYWTLYSEAAEKNDAELLGSLCSDCFTEILDRVYIDEKNYIDHPGINDDGGFCGKIIHEDIITGRPGWITPDDIDIKTGHPFRIRKKETVSDVLKYWSPSMDASVERLCFPIRGYVTSCAAISLDLGIPVEIRQPKMMVRVCSSNPPAAYFSDEEYAEINKSLNSDDYLTLKAFSDSRLFEKIKMSDSPEALTIKEQVYMALGMNVLKSGKICENTVQFGDFSDYISRSRQTLERAIKEKQTVIFVTGHRNPDSDTVISSAFEAYRFTLNSTDCSTVYLPIVQSTYIPDEIREILGDEISDSLITESEINIRGLLEDGRAGFIFTDQNYQQDIQKYVVCVTDHHKLSDSLKNTELKYPCCIELAGSCTSLIIRKYLGQNLDFDEKLSRILYSAMLMDTECRVKHKMTDSDYLVMNRFAKRLSAVSDTELYSQLMYKLVSEKSVSRLYKRDYKRFRRFGFATLKVTDVFENDNFGSFLSEAYELADRDNKENNFYFTLVKITQYCRDGVNVEKERFYYAWNSNADRGFKEKIRGRITDSVRAAFPAAVITDGENYTEVSGIGMQVSRKQIAPELESLVIRLTEFVYFKSIGKWVSRDFMKSNNSIREKYPRSQTDKNGNICNISFADAKEIVSETGMSLLSLPEFWKVYHEAEKMNDVDMLESMKSGEFIEFIDTVSVGGKLINHPVIDGSSFTGTENCHDIIPAVPGLINTDDIDEQSGLPRAVHNPSEEDKTLWRYWSPPESGTYIFSRSHIFLIGQPCLDAKMLPDESFMNLGIRPVKE